MTATILEVLDALDAVLQTIPDLRVADYKATNVTPPMAYTAAPDIASYNDTFEGLYTLTFTIVLLVSPTDMRAGERQIATFADRNGEQSIYHAVNVDPSLSGLVGDANLQGFTRFDAVVADTIGYPGGTIPVAVML